MISRISGPPSSTALLGGTAEYSQLHCPVSQRQYGTRTMTDCTDVQVHKACVLNTFLYSNNGNLDSTPDREETQLLLHELPYMCTFLGSLGKTLI